LMMQCITVPDVGYMDVWGVSNNTRSYWDNTGAEKLGFAPTQNSEAFAAEILKQPNPLDPIAQQYMGGSFVVHDFTPLNARPGKS
jgi:uronate dehydrogenase